MSDPIDMEFQKMQARIEELEAWQAEALAVLAEWLAVLAEWENVWENGGWLVPLKSSKALSTMYEIERHKAQL